MLWSHTRCGPFNSNMTPRYVETHTYTFGVKRACTWGGGSVWLYRRLFCQVADNPATPSSHHFETWVTTDNITARAHAACGIGSKHSHPMRCAINPMSQSFNGRPDGTFQTIEFTLQAGRTLQKSIYHCFWLDDFPLSSTFWEDNKRWNLIVSALWRRKGEMHAWKTKRKAHGNKLLFKKAYYNKNNINKNCVHNTLI
jgi:hypothetical protein